MTYLSSLGGGDGIASVAADTTPQLGGDLDVNGNAIVSVDNVDIEIIPNGTGEIILDGLKWPQADGTDGQVLKTDGSAQLSWTSASGGVSDIVDDTTPQLGGDLDVAGNSIVSASDGDIAITPNGTGDLILDGLKWPQADGSASQVLKTDGSAQLSWVTPTAYLSDVVDDTTPQLGGNLAVGANTITGYTASRAIETDASGNIQASDVTTAELAYLDGAEAAVNVLAPQYQTIYIDAGAMVPCTTNGAEAGTNEYATNDNEMDYLAFDGGATEERAQFKIVMPQNWDRSTVKAKFIWSSATGATSGDTVEWGLKGISYSNSLPLDRSWGTAQVVSDALTANSGADIQISGATPAITIADGPGLDELVLFEVYRNTDGTDTMAEDAWLFGVLIQYKVTNTVSAW